MKGDKKMRKGFSLIELVFVILITAIIAATALPRFMNISEDAHVSKLQSFVGTLNRSVGPMLWSGVLRKEPNTNGSVANSDNFNHITVEEEVDSIPSEFVDLGDPASISLENCISPDHTVPPIGSPVDDLTDGKIAETTEIGGTVYVLGCIDSDLQSSPQFYLYDENESIIVY